MNRETPVDPRRCLRSAGGIMTHQASENLPASREVRTDLSLPRPVQEHLARQLRAFYVERQERPAYLGDPALPSGFEEHLYRLGENERSRERKRASECGLAAVRTALEGAGMARDQGQVSFG